MHRINDEKAVRTNANALRTNENGTESTETETEGNPARGIFSF